MKTKEEFPYKVTKEDLQQYGSLFGGRLLSLIDSHAHWLITKNIEYLKVVTLSIEYNFIQPILFGHFINFSDVKILYPKHNTPVIYFTISNSGKTMGYGTIKFYIFE